MGAEEVVMRLAKIQRRQKIGSRDWLALQVAMDTIEANRMIEELFRGLEEYHEEETKHLKLDDEQED